MLEDVFRKLAVASSILIGLEFAASSLAALAVLAYYFLNTPISSVDNVVALTGTSVFMLAFIILIVVGALCVAGGIRYYAEENPPEKLVKLAMLSAALYILCLGVGSLFSSDLTWPILFLILGAILIMLTAALHNPPSPLLKAAWTFTGVAGAILVGVSIMYFQPLAVVFPWDSIIFTGPFLSYPLLEGLAIILLGLAAYTPQFFKGTGETRASKLLFGVVAIIFGVGIFVGTLMLSLSLLNSGWKAVWGVPPFNEMPEWALNAVMYWAVELATMMFTSVIVIATALVSFVTKEGS